MPSNVPPPSRAATLPTPTHPGEIAAERALERVAWWMFLSGAAVASTVQAGVQWYLWLVASRPLPWEATVLAVATDVWLGVVLLRQLDEVRRIYKGVRGERQVGAILEDLRTDGYRVIHSLPVGGADNKPVADVDHVLVGPGGVFAIETKYVSKGPSGKARRVEYDGVTVRIDGHAPDRDPVAQASRSAADVARMIRERTGRSAAVIPVVVYPGCWVSAPGAPPSGVAVLNPKQLFGWLRFQRTAAGPQGTFLNPDEIALYHHVLLDVQSLARG
jgi:hypothetical protein